MGHGNSTPYELVTGSGMPELLRASLDLLTRLVTEHQKFIFVPSATSARELLTIGNALKPLQYAIIDTNEGLLKAIASGHYRGDEWSGLDERVEVLSLVNNWILHKIGDASVIARLKRSIGGISEGFWQTMPSLAPGQAVVSFTTLTRPLRIGVDPTPCKLLMDK
jgi:hypothetical protein